MEGKPLTQKQEDFALNIFKGMSQREAYVTAGYSHNFSMAVLDVKASELAADGKLRVRLEELRQPAANSAIATVEERKERLSTFIREDLEGKFGITRHSNIQATAELNKMEQVYETGTNINIDNRSIHVTVSSEKGKEQLGKLKGGGLPELEKIEVTGEAE